MIERIVLDGVESRVLSREPTQEFHTSIHIDEVEIVEGRVMVGFVWDVTYGHDLGYIKMDGAAYVSDSPDAIAQIQSQWKEDKSLPPEMMKETLDRINYFCVLNSPFAVRPLNLVPPIYVPGIGGEKEG